MRVICIDASNIIYATPLIEGECYDAIESPFYKDAYMIHGHFRNKSGGFAS